MKNIAPDILRQRLLVEAYYQNDIDKKKTEKFLLELPKHLNLKTYGFPTVHVTGEVGANEGYDGFIPLVDSGISVYVWTSKKFLSVVLFTCKKFDVEKTIEFIKTYFNTTEEIVWKEF
jgi:S-adenosylmethionine/arginine decarboxylase-like enzyme